MSSHNEPTLVVTAVRESQAWILLVNHLLLYFIHIYLLGALMTNVAEAVLFIFPFSSDQPCTVATFHGSSVTAPRGGAGQRLSEPIAALPRLSIYFDFLVIK